MVSHVKKRTQRVFENRVATYFGEYLDRRRMKWRQAGKNYILRTSTVFFVRLLLNKLLHDQIKEGEMGGACRTHEGDEKFVNILLESLKRRHHLEP
jgi:hypothetical protein